MSSVLITLFVLFGFATSMGLLGGLTDGDVSDPKFMELAWKAVINVNADLASGGVYYMVPIKVLRAQTQLVAGVRYVLEVLYGESACKKEVIAANESELKQCELKKYGKRVIYKVETVEQPWNSHDEIRVMKIRDVSAYESQRRPNQWLSPHQGITPTPRPKSA
ncbi:hypothetical protein KIN20_002497 [Parelaphostrongylus tenuis]|uniref:Cystatin domain-containing protein n=1 Tax=Parelaphostrongylus tenuis TaxID=148309 RepID=A0AAD5MNN9_PARTN|nr:hypothetical protein KIN20_002497 [Parelaphostrongylus tenuis]